MADYKKYAEDLIGDWERDQYAPQKDILENIYQTNWDRLSNDFSDLKDRLARNFENARLDYRNIINNVQNQSFNRMRGANIDLALRGLSSSGMGDQVTQADTQLKGEAVDKALSDLLNTNNAAISAYVSGLDKYGAQQTKLANQVATDLGKITDAEAANGQQYANLVAGIGEGAAQRAASSASASASAALQKAQEEAEDMERKILIMDTLASEDLTDNEKAKYLRNYLGVDSIETARQAVEAYNNNAKMKEKQDKADKLQQNVYKAYDLNNFYNLLEKIPFINRYITPSGIVSGGNPLNVTSAFGTNIPEFALNAYINSRNKKINELQNQTDNMTYQDLYNILYGDK